MIEPDSDRRAFKVVYTRRGATDRWGVIARAWLGLRGTRDLGVVAEAASPRDGEARDDEGYLLMTVLVEDATSGRDLGEAMHDEARHLADRRFHERHPEATLEPIDGSGADRVALAGLELLALPDRTCYRLAYALAGEWLAVHQDTFAGRARDSRWLRSDLAAEAKRQRIVAPRDDDLIREAIDDALNGRRPRW